MAVMDGAAGHAMAEDAEAHCHDEPPSEPERHADCCDVDRRCYAVVSGLNDGVDESETVLTAFAELKRPVPVVASEAPNRLRVRETLPPPDAARRRSATPHEMKVRFLI